MASSPYQPAIEDALKAIKGVEETILVSGRSRGNPLNEAEEAARLFLVDALRQVRLDMPTQQSMDYRRTAVEATIDSFRTKNEAQALRFGVSLLQSVELLEYVSEAEHGNLTGERLPPAFMS